MRELAGRLRSESANNQPSESDNTALPSLGHGLGGNGLTIGSEVLEQSVAGTSPTGRRPGAEPKCRVWRACGCRSRARCGSRGSRAGPLPRNHPQRWLRRRPRRGHPGASGSLALISSRELDRSDLENPAGVISSRELDRSDLENPAGGGTLQLAGVHGWRGVRQGGVGTEMVVVLPPGFDLRTGILQRHEPVHVQALVA